MMFASFIEKAKVWGSKEPLVDAVILAGSYARGTQKPDSDIDLIILTSNKKHFMENPQIFSFFEPINRSAVEFYGECTSIRVWYTNGLEVEFGMVPLKWIDLPLDPGTEQVLSDGYQIIVDKKGLFLPIAPVIPEHIS